MTLESLGAGAVDSAEGTRHWSQESRVETGNGGLWNELWMGPLTIGQEQTARRQATAMPGISDHGTWAGARDWVQNQVPRMLSPGTRTRRSNPGLPDLDCLSRAHVDACVAVSTETRPWEHPVHQQPQVSWMCLFPRARRS